MSAFSEHDPARCSSCRRRRVAKTLLRHAWGLLVASTALLVLSAPPVFGIVMSGGVMVLSAASWWLTR